MSTVHSRYPLPGSATNLTRRATLGIGFAVVAVLLAQALVGRLAIDVGAGGPMTPFAAAPLVGTTVVAGGLGTLVYAGLIRYTDRPVRNFAVVAAAVFALQLVPVVAFAPSLGVTPVGQAVLVAYHAIVAVPIVAFLVGLVP